MKSLYNTILESDKIDGHIHLFDHKSVLYDLCKTPAEKSVGFLDLDLAELDKYECEDVIKYYDNFITNYYDSNVVTLLATGKDPETMITLYNTYPDIIKGFGEIKCYGQYTGLNRNTPIKLPYNNLKWFESLCEFNTKLRLPIYLHWYIYNEERKEQLKTLLNKYPDIPFVLCHCGMSFKYDYTKQYLYLLELLKDCRNLYVDISYKPILFFIYDKKYLKPLVGRCLIGSDINPKGYNTNDTVQYIHAFNDINQFELDCRNTFNKLFKR